MDRTAAEFAALPGQPETVTRRGKLFETGSFPDKKFSLTAAEMQAACREFQPVPLDLEHLDETILSGKLGRLREAWAEGGVLFGAVEIPRWLHETIGADPLKVSCTWDRATKRLTRLALVTRPRITDAALFAAFTAASGNTDEDEDEALFADDEALFAFFRDLPVDPAAATFYDEDEPRDESGEWTSGGAGDKTPKRQSGGMEDKSGPRGDLKAIYDQIQDLKKNYSSEYTWGVRWDKPGLEVGHTFQPSRVWVDGKPTRKKMPGTSVVRDDALKVVRSSNFYTGVPYIVCGIRAPHHGGLDAGEEVLEECEVMAVPKTG